MSTEQANGKVMEEKKDKVAEVTEKLDNLAVDKTNEANDNKPARRGGRGFRGRGRGRGGRMGYVPRPPYEEQVKQIEEDLKTKRVLEKGVKGYVKWFSVRGRYGFVAREKAADETEDFFVHQTAISKSSTIKYYLRTLEEDEPVVFDIVEGRKGPEAANVTGPDGENVRGSRFARSLLTRWGHRGGARGGRAGGRKPRENTGDDKEKPAAQEESGDGEVRGKRRVRRARGKLQPDAENGEKPQEKGDGDAAPADGEKKGRRRNRNTKGKKEAGEATEQKQEAAPTKA